LAGTDIYILDVNKHFNRVFKLTPFTVTAVNGVRGTFQYSSDMGDKLIIEMHLFS